MFGEYIWRSQLRGLLSYSSNELILVNYYYRVSMCDRFIIIINILSLIVVLRVSVHWLSM